MSWIDAEDYMVLRVVHRRHDTGVEGWYVHRTDNAGIRNLGGRRETKKEAVKDAKYIAKRNKPAKLFIEKKNGNVNKKHSYN